MASETRARQSIDNILRSLNWQVEGEGRNVLLESESRKNFPELERKRPDYVLMQSDSLKPLAVVEAKSNQTKFKDGLEQARKYAKIISAPLIFVSDGFSTIAKTTDDHFIMRDGGRVNGFLSEPDILRFLKYGNISTPDTTIKKQQDLIAKYKKASKILRGEGLDGLESLYEFCIILFIKIASETGKIFPNYDWDSLTQKSGKPLMEHYLSCIDYFKKRYTGVFKEVNISKPKTLEGIIKLLDNVNFSDTDIDIKGGAYEYFLSKYSMTQRSALGQYFTPRHIVEMMVSILSPDYERKEKIYDPFCGTGGMLVQCYRKIFDIIGEKNDEAIDFLKKDSLYGQDNSPSLAQIAKMNMILIGDGHNNINRADSITNPPQAKYDIVISNIPFNLEPVEEHIARDCYQTTETDANAICVRHCIESVVRGGRMAIIVPETIGYSDKYESLRDYLLNKGNIQAIIRLPRATFKQYTTAKTFIIYMTDIHIKKTKSFHLVEIKNDGFSNSVWRESIEQNDIFDFFLKIDDLENNYPKKTPKHQDGMRFFSQQQVNSLYTGEGIKLRDLIVVKKQKTSLSQTETYYQPRLSSKTNTISKNGSGRLGENIKGDKVIIEPNDLVIGIYHTQNYNGLFAISDDYYFATSQIVAKIKDDVNVDWLVFMLRNLLPKLQSDDLTGREPYKPKEILDIIIPYPPPTSFDDLVNKKDFYQKEKRRMRDEIEELENKILEEVIK